MIRVNLWPAACYPADFSSLIDAAIFSLASASVSQSFKIILSSLRVTKKLHFLRLNSLLIIHSLFRHFSYLIDSSFSFFYILLSVIFSRGFRIFPLISFNLTVTIACLIFNWNYITSPVHFSIQ